MIGAERKLGAGGRGQTNHFFCCLMSVTRGDRYSAFTVVSTIINQTGSIVVPKEIWLFCNLPLRIFSFANLKCVTRSPLLDSHQMPFFSYLCKVSGRQDVMFGILVCNNELQGTVSFCTVNSMLQT